MEGIACKQALLLGRVKRSLRTASVSSRGSSRKLGREQKKKMNDEEGAPL